MYVLDQLPRPGEITSRKMMGEYLLYYHGRLFGGIYENRFLVKPTPSAWALLPEAALEPPEPRRRTKSK